MATIVGCSGAGVDRSPHASPIPPSYTYSSAIHLRVPKQKKTKNQECLTGAHVDPTSHFTQDTKMYAHRVSSTTGPLLEDDSSVPPSSGDLPGAGSVESASGSDVESRGGAISVPQRNVRSKKIYHRPSLPPPRRAQNQTSARQDLNTFQSNKRRSPRHYEGGGRGARALELACLANSSTRPASPLLSTVRDRSRTLPNA